MAAAAVAVTPSTTQGHGRWAAAAVGMGAGGSTGRVEGMLKAATVGCAAPGCMHAPRPGAPDVIGAAAATRVDVAAVPFPPRRTAAAPTRLKPSWLIPSAAGDGHGDRNEQPAAPVAAAVPFTSARRRHAGTGVGTAASTRAGVGPIMGGGK